eukprot:jgi/Undpi1/5433/HiC_scaffold_2.g00712.m1
MSTLFNHQNDRAYPDGIAAETFLPRSVGFQEHKGSRPEPPSPTSNASIVSIRERLGRIINQQLEHMEKGEISQLSDQHNTMLQQLTSLSISGSNASRAVSSRAVVSSRASGGYSEGTTNANPCTYDRCDKPVGHWESTCLQKARDLRSRRENNHASKRDRSTFPRGNSRRFHRHHRDDDDECDDDAEDDPRSQTSSTRGDDNGRSPAVVALPAVGTHLATCPDALDNAGPGTTILLKAGTYYEALKSRVDGTKDRPITIKGPSSGGTAIVKGDDSSEACVEINHDFYVLDDFTICGQIKDDCNKNNVKECFREKCLIIRGTREHRNLKLDNGDHLLSSVDGCVVKNMKINNCGGEGIRLRYFVTRCTLFHNRITSTGCFDFKFGVNRGIKNGEGIYIGTSSMQWNKNPTGEQDICRFNRVYENYIDTRGNECVAVKEGAMDTVIETNYCTGQLDEDSAGIDSRASTTIIRYNKVVGCKGAGVRLGGHKVGHDQYGIACQVYCNILTNNEYGGIKIMTEPHQIRQNTITKPGHKYKMFRGECADKFEECSECPFEVDPPSQDIETTRVFMSCVAAVLRTGRDVRERRREREPRPGKGRELLVFLTQKAMLVILAMGQAVYLGDGGQRCWESSAQTQVDGTKDRPITIKGPSSGGTAIVKGDDSAEACVEINHDFYVLDDFTICGQIKDDCNKNNVKECFREKCLIIRGTREHRNLKLDNGDHLLSSVDGCVVKNMKINNCGGEGIRLRYFVTRCTLFHNRIMSTGCFDFKFGVNRGIKNGEGIYIGTSSKQWNKNPTGEQDICRFNRVYENYIDTRGNECVAVKEGAMDTVIETNYCTGQLDEDSAGIDSRASTTIIRYNKVVGCKGAGVRLGGHKVGHDQYGIACQVYCNILTNNEYGGIKIMTEPHQIRQNTITKPGHKYKMFRGECADKFEECSECPFDVDPPSQDIETTRWFQTCKA